MVSKRCYQGTAEWLDRLEGAFNILRPRTAERQTDRDGTENLFVLGWSDPEAAAVYLLTRSAIPTERLSESLVARKVRELETAMAGAKEQVGLNAKWLGTVIMSDKGSRSVVAPDELQEEEARKLRPDPPEEDDSYPDPEKAIWSAHNEPLLTGAEMWKGLEDREEASSGYAQKTVDEWPEGLEKKHLEVRVPLDARTLGKEDEGLLFMVPKVEVIVRIEGEAWRLVRLLSVAFDCGVVEMVERLLTERLDYYRDPAILPQILGAADN